MSSYDEDQVNKDGVSLVYVSNIPTLPHITNVESNEINDGKIIGMDQSQEEDKIAMEVKAIDGSLNHPRVT